MAVRRMVCVVTGTRAEYGLLCWLMKKIDNDPTLGLQIIATGMHLSSEFGLTYEEIESDGFTINQKVEMLLSSDTQVGISKSIGLGIIGFADAFEALRPHLVVVLGDRFEAFSAVTAALIAKIPVAHLHGGETTEGAFDEGLRHSITKMSHLHFVSTETYRRRVIQLGEQPDRVFNVGALGVDNINRLPLLSREAFENAIRFKLGERNLLITFHPATLEEATSREQFFNLLSALNPLKKTHCIFTKANADTNGRIINEMIDRYVAKNSTSACAHASLGRQQYLSALQYVDAVVGNSSSGLIEAPTFKVATINIGDRQRGRIKAESVIDCEPTVTGIRSALRKIYDKEFRRTVQKARNPYEKSGTVEKIMEILKSYPIEGIVKKQFFDVGSVSQ